MMPAAHHEAINLTSLNLVREELIVTVERATLQLEGFIENQEDTELLQCCVDSLEQICGSLDVVQLYGACELASEILDSTNGIVTGALAPLEEGLSILTRSFFILSRYFEYVLQSQKALPALLIPYVNDIRIVYRRELMPESYFFDVDVNQLKTVKQDSMAIGDGKELAVSVSRLRHMYQVGLLGAFKQVSIKPSISLMCRAVNRIATLTEGYRAGTFWWVTAVAISLFDEADLELTRERKRSFGKIDRQLKQLINNGLAQLDQLPPVGLLQELIYYIALSGVENDSTKAVQSLYAYQPLSYCEREFQREQRVLAGPNANTVGSLVSTLQEELQAVKTVVETAAESNPPTLESYENVTDKINKIKEILRVIGLETAALTMEQQLDKINQWQKNNQPDESSQLLEIADALIYVETMLNGLGKLNFSDERLSGLNKLDRRKLIVSSQLAEAQLVVLQEIEAGLSTIKRSLNAFSDSEFDTAHILDVPAALGSIRGGMILLERPRAAAIIASCMQFIENTLLANKQLAAMEHMLNTFADALSGLEYYMECLKVDANIDDEILVVAENSLAALGYSVEHT